MHLHSKDNKMRWNPLLQMYSLDGILLLFNVRCVSRGIGFLRSLMLILCRCRNLCIVREISFRILKGWLIVSRSLRIRSFWMGRRLWIVRNVVRRLRPPKKCRFIGPIKFSFSPWNFSRGIRRIIGRSMFLRIWCLQISCRPLKSSRTSTTGSMRP